MPDNSVVEEVTKRTLEMMDEVTEKVRDMLGYRLGMEEVRTRYVRGLIRQSIQGDEAAFARLQLLYSQQVVSPNPVDAEIEVVLREEQ